MFTKRNLEPLAGLIAGAAFGLLLGGALFLACVLALASGAIILVSGLTEEDL